MKTGLGLGVFAVLATLIIAASCKKDDCDTAEKRTTALWPADPADSLDGGLDPDAGLSAEECATTLAAFREAVTASQQGTCSRDEECGYTDGVGTCNCARNLLGGCATGVHRAEFERLSGSTLYRRYVDGKCQRFQDGGGYCDCAPPSVYCGTTGRCGISNNSCLAPPPPFCE